jgi:hypothetical protein
MTVYCHAGLFVLQTYIDKATFGDLDRLVDAVQNGKLPQLPQRFRRVRSSGIS